MAKVTYNFPICPYVKHVEYLLYLDETLKKMKWFTIGISIYFFNKHLLSDKSLLSYNLPVWKPLNFNKPPEAYGSVYHKLSIIKQKFPYIGSSKHGVSKSIPCLREYSKESRNHKIMKYSLKLLYVSISVLRSWSLFKSQWFLTNSVWPMVGNLVKSYPLLETKTMMKKNLKNLLSAPE